MYNLIYEATDNTIISLPFIIVCILELIIVFYAIFTWKCNKIDGKIGLCIVSIILLIIIVSIIFEYINTKTLYTKYETGDFLVAEGIIENYEIGTNEKASFPDRFTINGISFIVSNNPYTGYGYTLRYTDGGILENGTTCKIHYIPYKGDNIIMALYIVAP